MYERKDTIQFVVQKIKSDQKETRCKGREDQGGTLVRSRVDVMVARWLSMGDTLLDSRTKLVIRTNPPKSTV